MKNLEIKNLDCHAALAMTEKRWGFPRRTLRALLGMTENAQSGRSMIEMLGVLAIIGVLSVGGIAGYSKAMTKYRINKTIEQITLIAGNIRSFFAPQGTYDGVDCSGVSWMCSNEGCAGIDIEDPVKGCPVVKKAKIIPEEMLTITDGKITGITSAFGYGFILHSSFDNKPKFYIGYYIGDNIEACIELLTHDWSISGVTEILLDDRDEGIYLLPPVSLDLATEKCSIATDAAIADNVTSLGFPSIIFTFD